MRYCQQDGRVIILDSRSNIEPIAVGYLQAFISPVSILLAVFKCVNHDNAGDVTEV